MSRTPQQVADELRYLARRGVRLDQRTAVAKILREAAELLDPKEKKPEVQGQ